MPSIMYEKSDRIAYITLNRPEAMNALGPPHNDEIIQVWTDFRDDPDVWVAILTGAGDKAFCAGADLKTYTPLLSERDPYDVRQDANRIGFGGITRSLEIWKPIIAAVNGYALAGGRSWRWPATSVWRRRTPSLAAPRCDAGFTTAMVAQCGCH